jgi:FKBP-type peptidyl-prolyl cis-trans isomerase
MMQRTIFIAFSTALLLSGCEPEGKPAPGVTPAPPAPANPSSTAPGSAASASREAPKTGAVPAAGLSPATAAAGVGAAKTASAVKTASGLEYTVLKEGAGASPALGSTVKVHVTGWLPDGKTFMDTRATGVPKQYKLDSLEMISGWVEALQNMRTGEKRRLHVPSGLAFGVRGFPEVVPPRTDVDFEIELVSFTPPGVK